MVNQKDMKAMLHLKNSISSNICVLSSLPRLVMLSWLTSLRWATLPWFEPDRGLSPSMDVHAMRVASEMANCCRIPEVRVERIRQGHCEVLVVHIKGKISWPHAQT